MIKCYVYLNSTLILERITINTNKVLLFYVQPHVTKLRKIKKKRIKMKRLCFVLLWSRAEQSGLGLGRLLSCYVLMCYVKFTVNSRQCGTKELCINMCNLKIIAIVFTILCMYVNLNQWLILNINLKEIIISTGTLI